MSAAAWGLSWHSKVSRRCGTPREDRRTLQSATSCIQDRLIARQKTWDVGGPAYLWRVRWRAPRLSPGWIVPCSGRPRPRHGSSRSVPRSRDDSPAGTSPFPHSGRRPAGSDRPPRQKSRPAPLQLDPCRWTKAPRVRLHRSSLTDLVGCSGGSPVAQLSADHLCVLLGPVVVTHRPPVAVVENL